ncbi:protein timeless isoform X2 [Aricia agestis]|uniref:protein timeless isoform X2 n=1 Tax=Aricia agestis TaxID=91739 RepID=UPI001C201668|nr:protein timeless isoform X2 [Aricia agestis]
MVHWAVTMVQLIALLYKDQHVTTLHKLLNIWLETTLSESSEDNESNTSPQNGGSDHSSPILTSDPTSDSSDTVGSGKSDEDMPNNTWENTTTQNKETNDEIQQKAMNEKSTYTSSDDHNIKGSSESDLLAKDTVMKEKLYSDKKNKRNIEFISRRKNQETTTTSSNEDELPAKKPHNSKPRMTSKQRPPSATPQDRKRKKIVKRGKLNILNAKGLTQTSPTDDDISIVLKEFTVCFLLKGYNSLVRTLHSQILTTVELEIDTSHFFWLVTYFLKFATQIELDLEHVSNVLSFDIISYLTAEGVNLCEQFELTLKMDGNDLRPCVRRLHLAVTAIREFVQAIDVFKKAAHVGDGDKGELFKLQLQMCETEQLRSLMVLLLRYYNPKHHSKQYLQDIIVTNHILLMCLDTVMRSSDYKGTTMVEHIRQFSTPEIMQQYGLLLEDYEGNGEFVNDCVFTMMHHVTGELGGLFALFQPRILKTFTAIWQSEFEICDDWSDMIEYAINTFVKKPHKLYLNSSNMRLEAESPEDKKHKDNTDDAEIATLDRKSVLSYTKDNWSESELSSLSWFYMQCKTKPNVIGEIVNLFKEDGIVKTGEAIVKELFHQYVINKEEYESLLKKDAESSRQLQDTRKSRDNEIGKLCDQLAQDGKAKFLHWVQTVLLETCYAKIYLEKKSLRTFDESTDTSTKFDSFEPKPVVSPVPYHALIFNQSVPLVPWNCQQAAICRDLKFLQLIHKLGFFMPVDTGKLFIRIPNFWTADVLYEVAGKITPIDPSTLKFSLSDISQSSIQKSRRGYSPAVGASKAADMLPAVDNHYQVHKEKHLANILNFTPMPGSSFNPVQASKPNWLDLVKKAQEYTITLDLETSIVETNINLEQAKSSKCVRSSSSRAGSSLGEADEDPPPDDKLDVQTDFECNNNSVCETASVASDLTRMYVSDEDDKSDIASRPGSPMKLQDDDRSCSDLECFAPKRPRVQFVRPL